MRYVALLRGINVGGKNKVPMAELRALHESLGHAAVRTHINSGNVVFDAPRAKVAALSTQLEEGIEREFGVSARVLVLHGSTITDIAAALPEDWANDEEWKGDVLYLLPERDAPEALDSFAREPHPELEDIRYVKGALLARTARSLGSRSQLHKLTGRDLYPFVTIRNVNTARKLAAMVAED